MRQASQVVYLASPLRFDSHAEAHGLLIVWLGTYKVATPGVKLGIEPTVRLDQDNEPQPDGVLLIDERIGGQSPLNLDDYIEGAPELVAEVAASSAAIDLNDKKTAYCRNGAREYVVWQIFENRLDWFCLDRGEYVSLVADSEGVEAKCFLGCGCQLQICWQETWHEYYWCYSLG